METTNAAPGFHHAATDTAKGRASWNVRACVTEEETLLLNLDAAADRTLQLPMLHLQRCRSMTRKDLDRARVTPVSGVLFPALWRSEQAAYWTGAPRVVGFCLVCICEQK